MIYVSLEINKMNEVYLLEKCFYGASGNVFVSKHDIEILFLG